MDRMHDGLFDGTRPWMPTVADDHTRLCPAVRVRREATATEVIAALAGATAAHGVPRRIRRDNGARFTARKADLRACASGVVPGFGRPGKPTSTTPAPRSRRGGRTTTR
jgi:putative transposase